jgi:hypothetical protein
MNCSACGTPLPQAAANCPQCGAATRSYYSSTGAAPDDPTVVSFPDAIAPPPPPTTYGSSAYQNPYEPLNVAPSASPPPSPQRPANRIGIIVGVVLILLLLGGGVFGWLAYSSARNAATTAAVATTTAQAQTAATSSASAAVQHFTAKGTFTIVSKTTTSVRQDGQNKIYSYTQQEVISGDITGSFTAEETSIVHPDNSANFSGRSSCTCRVNGKSGTLMWSYTGTSTANGSFQGQNFDVHGTGDLAKLHGQGEFQGQGTHGTSSSQLYFDA